MDDDVRRVADAAMARLGDVGAALIDVDVSALASAARQVFDILLINGFKCDLAIHFARHAPHLS
jgi:hypothetical protein